MAFTYEDRVLLNEVNNNLKEVQSLIAVRPQLLELSAMVKELLAEVKSGSEIGPALTRLAADAKTGLDSIQSEVPK